MSFMFRSPLDIEIHLDGEDKRESVEVKTAKGRTETLLVYRDGETVKGSVTLRPRDAKKVEVLGVRVQLLGTIELQQESGSSSSSKSPHNDDFLSFAQELESYREITGVQTYHFEFKNVEKQYESYRGIHARLKYHLKVTVARKSADIVRQREFWVYQYRTEQTAPNPIASKSIDDGAGTVKMDVGIENCLHIEFEFSKNKFPLKGVIVGRIYFMLVRLKIKHMELTLIRRETIGTGPQQTSESSTVVRFEIMDGAPVKGETIPIRLFLGGFDLVPTYKDVNKKFSTRTFLSLVLIDEDGRRYFKQTEISLYREPPVVNKATQIDSPAQQESSQPAVVAPAPETTTNEPTSTEVVN